MVSKIVGSAQKVIVVPVFVTGPELLQRRRRLAPHVGLEVAEAVALDLDVELGRQRVHDAHADAVQTTGHGVGAGLELAAGVQRGEHDLDGLALLDRVAGRPGCHDRCRRTRTPPSASSVTRIVSQ